MNAMGETDGARRFVLDGLVLDIPEALLGARLIAALQSGWYERAEALALAAHLRPGDKVLELGGGLGYVTLQIARLVGPDNVVSVEAHPQLVPVLRANLARNGVDGVSVLEAAVVSEEKAAGGTTAFHMSDVFWASATNKAPLRRWRSTRTTQVPALAFEPLLAAHRPDVIVMDVEGDERMLLTAPLPDHVRLLIVEMHPNTYRDRIVDRMVAMVQASGLVFCEEGSQGDVVVFRRE